MQICPCAAGSPLLSRGAWAALLGEAGFVSVVVAGSECQVPPLLSQQSVIVGVSDGLVRVPRKPPVSVAAAAYPTATGDRRAGAAAAADITRAQQPLRVVPAAVLQVGLPCFCIYDDVC